MRPRSTTIRRVLVDSLPSGKGSSSVPLSEEEHLHLVSVLRMSDGEAVEILDGEGRFAAGILELRKKSASVAVDATTIKTSDEPRPPLVLEAAILKGDAMDWLIEKCVELGVRSIRPIISAHTVVRIGDRKGPEEFRERWQRLADQSLKQCGRKFRLRVEAPVSLETLMTAPLGATESRFWLNEASRAESPHLIAQCQDPQVRGHTFRILLGPEGGFSYAERELLERDPGVHSTSLGPWVLRAETAGIAAAAIAVTALLAQTDSRGESHHGKT